MQAWSGSDCNGDASVMIAVSKIFTQLFLRMLPQHLLWRRQCSSHSRSWLPVVKLEHAAAPLSRFWHTCSQRWKPKAVHLWHVIALVVDLPCQRSCELHQIHQAAPWGLPSSPMLYVSHILSLMTSLNDNAPQPGWFCLTSPSLPFPFFHLCCMKRLSVTTIFWCLHKP